MNPEILALVNAYRSGQIGPDIFLQRMSAMGFDQAAATKFLVDAEVAQRNPPPASAAAPTAQAAPQPAPQATPPAPTVTPAPSQPTRQNYTGSTPYYQQDTIPVGPASNAVRPYIESRSDRARISDLPTDFGSPAGTMAYPGNLDKSAYPTPTIERAVRVARDLSSGQTAAGEGRPSEAPSALAALIRGRFGEAAKGNPMDDRLTAFQEARDKSGDSRASGGAVGGRDAALHKALEIIHHLIQTR